VSAPLTAGLRVGDELPPLAAGPISRATLALFAGASGDHNPIHIDLDVARAAGLDDVFAHGMLSMAHLGRLVTGWVPAERLRSLQARFVSITPVLAEPTCHGTVRELRDDGTAVLDLVVRLADGTPTLTGTAVIDVTTPAATGA